jgi:mRNA interferase MazF
VSNAPYVPDVGHIIWLGRRPFLVLSPRAYNAKTSLAIGVPVTTARKGYPFEVPLDPAGRVSGVALADQVKSLDWRARFADYAEDVAPATLHNVRAMIATLLDLR